MIRARTPQPRASNRHRLATAAAILAVSIVALATTSVGPLYAQTYPGPGTVVVSGPQDLERAFTKASLHTMFSSDHLVENERTRFTATIDYGRSPGPGPTIKVAYANDASLQPLDAKQFDITPVTPPRQYLSEGTPDGRGGFQLDWAWDVTPRATGPLTLELQIQPYILFNGTVVNTLELRNKPIAIDVLVHPNHLKLDAVVAHSATDFALTVPDKLEVDKPATITASIPLQGTGPDVRASLSLSAADGSVPVTISQMPQGSGPPADIVRAEWQVTPEKDGDVRLKATATISTQIGDRELERQVDKPVAKVAETAPSFWGSIQGVITALSAFIALVVAIAGLAKIFPRQWKWLRRKLHIPDQGSTEPPPQPPSGS